MSLNEVSIKIPGEYIPNVFGQFDAFAKKIERTLHVTLVLRDDSLKIIGAQGNIDGAKEVFEQLIALAERGNVITEQNVNYALALLEEHRGSEIVEIDKDIITDEYIKAVQKQFKHYHAADTRFISDLKDAVISYAAQQDSLDYEQLVSQFGDPQELVNDYFSEQSIDKQKKNVCFTWNIKTICIIITVFVLIFSAIYIYNINVQHKKELDTFIQKEVTILKEDPQ